MLYIPSIRFLVRSPIYRYAEAFRSIYPWKNMKVLVFPGPLITLMTASSDLVVAGSQA